MSYRSDNSGYGIFWLGAIILYVVYENWKWPGLLLAIVAFVILAYVAHVFVKVSEYRDSRKRSSEPCKHGIAGAAHVPSLCPSCLRDFEALEEKHKQEQIDAKRRKEESRQRAYDEWVAKVRVPQFLKTVDPQEFEKIVCKLFSRMGYRVEGTRYVGDNGSDGFLFKGDSKTVLQCKRVQGSVGEPVLRDLFGTMHATGCNDAIVVTTGTVSRQAREWVEGKPIRLVEIDELNRLFKEHFKENELVPDDFSVEGFVNPDECPKCGELLRIRRGRRGQFWGCSAYPRCRYTRDVEYRAKS
jgi:hypothetical protein